MKLSNAQFLALVVDSWSEMLAFDVSIELDDPETARLWNLYREHRTELHHLSEQLVAHLEHAKNMAEVSSQKYLNLATDDFVEAMQYDGTNQREIASWTQKGVLPISSDGITSSATASLATAVSGHWILNEMDNSLTVHHSRESILVHPNDWIVKAPSGEIWTCTNDSFLASYAPA